MAIKCSGGSIVDKASTIGIEISLASPLIFTRGQKVRNLASFSTLLNFEPPAFENERYSNAETNFLCRNDASAEFCEVGSTNP